MNWLRCLFGRHQPVFGWTELNGKVVATQPMRCFYCGKPL